jgi:hypothetical protein
MRGEGGGGVRDIVVEALALREREGEGVLHRVACRAG